MSPCKPDVVVSAVLLTWNSALHVGQALASLSRELDGLAAEIVVVDNGSTDESVRIVQLTPQARIIRNTANAGVARARNQGLAVSTGRYILFLDSDAELSPGSVREMLRYMDATPAAGVVGPKLIYPDGTVQFSRRRFITVHGKVLRQLPLRLRRAIAWMADEEIQGIDRTVAQPVDYVIGACQLIRRDLIRSAGALDEHMFYGPEDVDFCLRAWQAGWEVHYVPSAVVVHHEQRITRRRPSVLTLRHGMALAYYFWKHRYLWRRPAREPRKAAAVHANTRVLELITLSDWGGAQQCVLSLATGLRDGYDVTVACGPGGPLVTKLRDRGIRVIEVESLVRTPHPLHDLSTLWTLIRLMRQERFSLVHCHSTKAGLLGRTAAWLAGVPAIIFTAHGWQFVGDWSSALRRCMVAAEWMVARLSTAIICVSEYDRQVAMQKHIGRPGQLIVIHNGVDPAPWLVGDERDDPRADIARPCTAVMVGRMTAQKDPATLIEAWRRVRGPHRLVLVGEGPLRSALEAQIRREGLADRVTLLASTTDIPSLLRTADLFVMSSRWEGLPLAIIEAMLTGLPVVGTSVGGVPEIVVDGETGFLVPPKDVDALASTLYRLLEDPNLRRRMGEAGRRRALAHFTESRMLAETAAVYARALEATARPAAQSA